MKLAELGRARTPSDECRRYRPMEYSFDTRPKVLALNMDTFTSESAAMWRGVQDGIRQGLIQEYGFLEHQRKLQDFTDLGPEAWSIIAKHNLFLRHARVAFVAGAYYASLTASAALGERILNQLFLTLKADFKPTADTYDRQSFDDWEKVIKLLTEWEVLDAETGALYRKLAKLRNSALHYSAALRLDYTDARESALTAWNLIRSIVEELFTPIGEPPRFVDGIDGQFYIARDREDDPLVKHFYLPACVLVSPNHTTTASGETFDDESYQNRFDTLTDEEFAAHVKDPR